MNTRIMVGLALACAFGAAQARAQAVSTDAAPAASSAEETAAMGGYAGPAASAPTAGRVADAGAPDAGGVHGDGGRVGRVERPAHLSAPEEHVRTVTHHSVHHRRR